MPIGEQQTTCGENGKWSSLPIVGCVGESEYLSVLDSQRHQYTALLFWNDVFTNKNFGLDV